jgi:ABC-type lipoprotein export system ATPase subunit
MSAAVGHGTMSQLAERSISHGRRSGEVLLRAEGIHRSFKMGDTELEILKGVDFTLSPGEFVAIEGRSGSGKSTLMHALAALDSVNAGSLVFDGSDYTRRIPPPPSRFVSWFVGAPGHWAVRVLGVGTIFTWLTHFLTVVNPTQYLKWAQVAAAMTIAEVILVGLRWTLMFFRFLLQFKGEWRAASLRNKQFGFVFQFYHLLPELNALENTLISSMIENSWIGFHVRRSGLRRRATELLQQLGLTHRLKHRPNHLSGGERQRVAIARALMNSPRILFADEPTGNLDADTGRQIMDLLENLHREHGQTIVMVTHDRALAREADRILILKDGKLESPT